MECKDDLWVLCENFVADNNITCCETIYQTDRVVVNALPLIERVCEIVGYEPEDTE